MGNRVAAWWAFSPLNDAQAQSIATWRYEPPYDVYDPGPHVSGLLNPAFRYYAATAPDGELLGFCCFGDDARVPGGTYPDDGALDVGIGLRPDWTGCGHGAGFLRAVLAFGREQFDPPAFRATVAAFNVRSLRTCERVGFRPIASFASSTTGMGFIILTRPSQGLPSPGAVTGGV